jgi:hypothetical protein
MATVARVRVQAGDCEGNHCCDPDDEVGAYPLLLNLKSPFLALCGSCWEHENRYRRQRGEELGCPEHWATRDWNAAERCRPLRLSVETAAIAAIDHARPAKASRSGRADGADRTAAA